MAYATQKHHDAMQYRSHLELLPSYTDVCSAWCAYMDASQCNHYLHAMLVPYQRRAKNCHKFQYDRSSNACHFNVMPLSVFSLLLAVVWHLFICIWTRPACSRFAALTWTVITRPIFGIMVVLAIVLVATAPAWSPGGLSPTVINFLVGVIFR
jgi:hypothetical protein